MTVGVVTKTGRRAGIGQRTAKVDAVPKVTGSFVFASDLHDREMLHGVTVRSPYAHARIVSIDVSEARDMPGVRAVLLQRDVPGRPCYGLEVPDQPVLAHDRVRYFGEPIAVLAADDIETAQAARAKVKVELEPLEPIVDPELALSSERLHDDPPREKTWRVDERPNVVRTVVIKHGDSTAIGEVMVSGDYELGMQDQAFLGPEAGMAVPDGDGGVDVYVATQYLHADLEQLVPCLALPEDKVRVHLAGVGGAFGGREDVSVQIHAAMLALRTGRAVRMSYDRQESFVGHVHRHPARISVEHHANRDGTLVAVRMRMLLDGGAYASGSPSVTSVAACTACGAYRVANASVEVTTLYTNNPPCGAMRGFGVVQGHFAVEAQMDKLAAALAMDPVELRLKNVLRPGDVMTTGQHVTGAMPLTEVLERCAAMTPPEPEPLPRDPLRLPGGAGNTTRGEGVQRGEGIALGLKNLHYSEGYDDYATARVRLLAVEDDELVAEVHSAAVEFGQGVTNVIVQVVHTELDVDDVVLVPPTTATMGSAGSTAASRQAWMAGGAVRDCCVAIRDELRDRERPLDPGETIDVERVFRHAPTSLLNPETGQVRGDLGERAFASFVGVAMRAVVEVDVDLGLVRVVWLGVAQEAGRVLNPPGAEGQVEGGTAQGLGLALMEEIQTRNGVIANASFTDYLIPTTLDVPPIDIEFVEVPEPEAPYGVKGLGEGPVIVAHAAIAAAIRDATARDVTRLPVRPFDIARAVHGG